MTHHNLFFAMRSALNAGPHFVCEETRGPLVEDGQLVCEFVLAIDDECLSRYEQHHMLADRLEDAARAVRELALEHERGVA